MNLFDMIGPVMIGPSSSHTAGAVRLGYAAGKILGEPPVRAVIRLSGSFAQTYRGHGTDKALLAGILGFAPDDVRIRDSLSLAEQKGLRYEFHCEDLPARKLRYRGPLWAEETSWSVRSTGWRSM